MTVDGTDFIVPKQRSHRRDKTFFSHKFRHAGFRYEIGVNIQTGDICWTNGPFKCGKWPDVKIFRRDLKHLLAQGEMVETDNGYPDVKCRTADMVLNRDDDRAKSRARFRHESINADLKDFGCLKQVWRHPLEKHVIAFNSCTFLLQLYYRMCGGPKFQVKY